MNTLIEQLNEVHFKAIEDMMMEVETVADEEPITLPAGSLKQFFRSYTAALAFITGNLEYVEQYLKTNNLI